MKKKEDHYGEVVRIRDDFIPDQANLLRINHLHNEQVPV
jgi:hypothetical protein